MAPQFTATMGPWARWLQACRARATSSLPVPDSPCTSTGAMPRATLAMRCLTACMAGDSPTMASSAPPPLSTGLAADAAEGLRAGITPGGGTPPTPWAAEATTRRNCLRSTGLVR